MADWTEVLDALELRLAGWRGGLDGAGPFPDEFDWPPLPGPCPEALRHRARCILAAQLDLQDEMTARRDALGSSLVAGGSAPRAASVPLFVDQRS